MTLAQAAAIAIAMTPDKDNHILEDRGLTVLVIFLSILLAWISSPFYGAILWSIVLALMFGGLQARIVKWVGGRRSLAASISTIAIILILIIPGSILGSLLVQQAISVYEWAQNTRVEAQDIISWGEGLLPGSARTYLENEGAVMLADLQDRVTDLLGTAVQFFAGQAVEIGQGTVSFFLSLVLALYIAFFLLRDGLEIRASIARALPLRDEVKAGLFERLNNAVRAIIKGTVVIAIIQGVLGGVAFAVLGLPGAVLWGTVMGVLSLIPAVGTALVWLPAVIYLAATGAWIKAVILLLVGGLIISSVDNVLRPILVGKDTQIPDYLVLVTTLGGLALFGMNGLIIGPVVAALFLASWQMYAAARAGEIPIEDIPVATDIRDYDQTG